MNGATADNLLTMAAAPGARAGGQVPGSCVTLDAVRARTAVAWPLGHVDIEEGLALPVSRQMGLVPLIGSVVAGRLTLADQLFEDFFVLPRKLIGEGTLFLLQVRGDSMIDAAIADGDLVVVREQPTAENGEIVAAMIDEEATIKTYKKSGNNIWLMPQNPSYQPIPGEKATVLGKVVAVIRRL
jgi:SOS regulatory protein LexA